MEPAVASAVGIHHQYADDTQLILSMSASTLRSDLSTLEKCSLTARQWFADNDLLLNADKSEVMFVGTSAQLNAASCVDTVTVAGVVEVQIARTDG